MHILFLCLSVAALVCAVIQIRSGELEPEVRPNILDGWEMFRIKQLEKELWQVKKEKKSISGRLGGVTKDRNRLFNLLKERIGR